MQLRIRAGVFCAVVVAAISILTGGCASKGTPRHNPPGQTADSEIKIGDKFAFHSKILNEERRYWVYLPPSYRNKMFAPQKYPVLFLLDGDANFHMASGVVQFMGAGANANIQIPELIIVAIPNTQRTRDLTPTRSTKDYNGKENESLASSGGGETFLRFLEQELIPRIESEYRTQPYRLLVGHSFGGLFAINAFVRQASIFRAFIAIDPSLWWDDHLLLRRAKSMARDLKGSVYISLANCLH